MELTQEIELIRCRGGEARRTSDRVVREFEFELMLNGSSAERGTCIPQYLEEMARGFLLTEGFVARPGQVRSVRVLEGEGRIEAETDGPPAPDAAVHKLPAALWDPATVMETAGRFLLTSELFRSTGSVHSALLEVAGEERYYAEDLGRHNAIDKVVGMAMAGGVDFGRCVLYTSGRLPVGMARKAVRAGIPVVVSRSAPTDLTLELAAYTGLTVIGFAREERMNLYAPLEGGRP